VLKQAELDTPVSELCRTHGISSATFYKWRSQFGGMDASMTRSNGSDCHSRSSTDMGHCHSVAALRAAWSCHPISTDFCCSRHIRKSLNDLQQEPQ